MLNLHPGLQALMGTEPIDLLRAVDNKPVEQQKAALAHHKTERAAKEQAARTRKSPATPQKTAVGEGTTTNKSGYAVITSGSASAPLHTPHEETGREREQPTASTTTDAIPEPRTDSLAATSKHLPQEPQGRLVPFDRPGELAMPLDVRVGDDDAFLTLLDFLYTMALDRNPVRARELARAFAEQAAARTG
ncbi:hypothetical protein [Streptomyces sp. NPDC004538]|uniref:hypothetical protein n=1 Tax=Streptomyces sp. NPDC004538 TaxID=3154279 RepID=UPI0033A82B4C